jgi:hypothetical protein
MVARNRQRRPSRLTKRCLRSVRVVYEGRERSDDPALGQRDTNTARYEEAKSDGPLAIGTLHVHKRAVSASMIRRRSR